MLKRSIFLENKLLPLSPRRGLQLCQTLSVLFDHVIPTISDCTMVQVPIELYEHTPVHTTAVVKGTCQCVRSSKQSLKKLKIIQHFFSWLWYTDTVGVSHSHSWCTSGLIVKHCLLEGKASKISDSDINLPFSLSKIINSYIIKHFCFVMFLLL